MREVAENNLERGTVLVTGANGFVGSAVTRALRQRGNVVRAAVRRATEGDAWTMPSLEVLGDWHPLLSDCRVIVHAAARVHQPTDRALNALSKFRAVNVAGTLHLAKQAALSGVSRFIFLSTIGVNGSFSTRPLVEQDPVCPDSPYAKSKWEAEQCLWQLGRQTGMEIVVIRAPLVYGPRAPGNFGLLARAIALGWPLPFASIVDNRRTMIGLDNLVDLIIAGIDNPAAANQVFLAGDDESLSTAEILRRMERVLGKKSRCFPFPPLWLDKFLCGLGKKSMARSLCRSLEVNNAKAHRLLGWKPRFSVDQGLTLALREQVIA